jgi:hypothetical protein
MDKNGCSLSKAEEEEEEREPLERLKTTRNAKKKSPAMDRKRVRKTPEWKRKRLL